MEIAYVLRELWRHKLWVAVAFVWACVAALAVSYRVEFAPPAVHDKGFSFGTAQTQVFVDAPNSPVASLAAEFEPLTQRAAVYAQLLQSSPVLDLVAEKVGVPSGAIGVAGPSDIRPVQSGRNVGSEERATEIAAEGAQYRIFAVTLGEVPVVTISTQASTEREAIRLADAAATTLVDYVRGYDTRVRAEPEQRVGIRQLGPATGATIASGTNRKVGALAFVAFFIAACGLILLVPYVRRNWRILDPSPAPLPSPHQNGQPERAPDVHDLPKQPVGHPD